MSGLCIICVLDVEKRRTILMGSVLGPADSRVAIEEQIHARYKMSKVQPLQGHLYL